MLQMVKVVSALLIAYGSMVAVKPAYLRRMLGYVSEGKKIYLAALARLVLGGILLSGAEHTAIDWWVMLVGLLLVWSAVIIFLLKVSVLHEIIEWWLKKNNKYLSLLGVFVALVGVGLLLAV